MKHPLHILLAMLSTSALAQSPRSAPLLDCFPDSKAPTFLTTPSQFIVSHQFHPNSTPSKWADGVDESKVFHASLTHQSVADRTWELRIGTGGQLYSIVSSFGQAIPPQSLEAPFVDEVFQMVAINTNLLDKLPDRGPTHIREESNPYIHQSGMYVGKKQPFAPQSPFYSPLLAYHENAANRSYTIMSWGQTPTPSIHRSDVLFVTRFRDLGAGAIEISYLCFNFGHYPLNGLNTPWGGVRTSTFPELVLSNSDGTYSNRTPYAIDRPGTYVNIADTGGWAAATRNAANPASSALALVFGRDRNWPAQHQLQRNKQSFYQHSPTVYGAGDTRHGPRDYTVMDLSTRVNILPGQSFFRRIYMVLGTLSEVADASRKLEPFTDDHLQDFTEDKTPLLPVYAKIMDNGQTLPTLDPPAPDAQPICSLYSSPVRGSKPLFLMQDTATNRYILSTDPALLSRKEPFPNPYPPSHPKHASFQDRVQYLNHEGRTRWLGLLGYVLPKDQADTTHHRYTPLTSIPILSDTFQQIESPNAPSLLVRTNTPN